jgi:glycosyltransferase involved in cell wall biosynthesis
VSGSQHNPEVLVIMPEQPWPVRNGWSSRHYQLTRALAEFCVCDVICLSAESPLADADIQRELGVRSFKSVPIKRVSRAKSALLSVMTGKPMGFYLFRSPKAAATFRESSGGRRYEKAVVLGDVCMAGYVVNISAHAIVLDMCDDLAGTYSRRAKVANPIIGAYYVLQSRAIKQFLGRLSPHISKILTVSTVDQEGLSKIVSVPVDNVPIGVDTVRFAPVDEQNAADGAARRLLFVGAMRAWPNRDGVEWFRQGVFPLIREKKPDAAFHIVGSGAESVKTGGEPIYVEGYREDLVGEYRACDVFVCPLRTGTGIKNKLLEAMACGCAIVSTSIGVEGLNVVHGKHLLIADDAAGFAASVVQLLESSTARERLRNEARSYAIKEMSLTVVREKLENALS